MLQVVLKFKYNFWQKIVQGADFFGHVPQSSEGRGHCGLFYDLGKKVIIIVILIMTIILIIIFYEGAQLATAVFSGNTLSCSILL